MKGMMMMEESRTMKSLKNIMMGFASKIVILIIGFVDRKFFIEILGEGMLSINGLFSDILLMLSLAELGMTNVMVFSYYKPLAEKNYAKVASLTSFYKKIYNTIAAAVALIGIILIPFLKYIVNLEEPIEHMTLIYLLFLANTVISYLFVYKSTVLTADQNGYIASKYQIVFDIIRQIVQIGVLVVFKNVLIYLGVKVLFAFAYNLFLVKYVEKRYAFLNVKDTEPLEKEDKLYIAKTIRSGFIYKMAGVLLNGTDKIIISSVVGTIWIGYLANYDTVFTSFTAFVVVFFSALTASLGNLTITSDAKKRLEIFNVMLFSGFWISRILVPCFFFLTGDLISLWIGEKFVIADSIVAVKLAMVYCTCTLNPIFSYREATGLYRKSKYMIFMGSIINIVLSLILGRYWGVFGVLLASIIAMLCTYIWYEPIILYHDYFEASPLDYFIRHAKNIVLLAITMIVTGCIASFITADTWLMLFVKAAICFITVNAISILFLWRSKEFEYLRSQVFSKLKRTA